MTRATLQRLPIIRRFEGGLLLTLVLCAFALWPLLYRPGLPNGDDVLYHVYRAAEMDRSWAHGVLIPQWAESFYTGYGAPVFHYYASLTYYLTSIFSRLFALDAVNSLRLLVALGIFMSGAGMYAFTRRITGQSGGVMAAVCYVYSPYLLLTEPYSRGAYPELLAFALFPLLMWRYHHLLENFRGGRSKALDFALAALLEGLLIITHNLMALVLSGLLVGWLMWGLVIESWLRRSLSKRYGLALLAVGLGVGLAAYFWLPVAQEGSAVKLANLVGTAELNYRNFFVPVTHLLEANPRPDAGAFNGLEHRLNLGLAQWVLGLSGAAGMSTVWLLWRRRFLETAGAETFINGLFFALAALALIFLILSASAPIWQGVAPLAFLQFPWRLLGPAVFCLSVLAGMNAVWLTRLPERLASLLSGGMVVFILVLAAPTLVVTEWNHPAVDTSVTAYHDAELRGLQRATTFSNEYLPSAVAVEPGATPRLLADYADGYPVNKAHLEALPQGVTVETLDHGPQHDVWRVSAPAAFTLEVLTYAFAGWTAEVDGQPVPITASDPHGLITFPVPAGEHSVRLYLGSTPPRDLGNAISLTSVVIVLLISWLYGRSSSQNGVQAERAAPPQHLRALLAGGLIALIALPLYLREGGAWVNSPPGQALLAQHQLNYRLDQGIHLIGYDINKTDFRPGERVEITVYWYASQPIPYGYSSFVHISTGGPPLAQADKLNPAGLPTVTWTSTGFIHDDYVIELPATMPPGEYQVSIGLYTCDTRPAGECGNGERLNVVEANGQPPGDTARLTVIRVG